MADSRIREVVESQRAFFMTHATKDVDFRIGTLKKLKKVILDNEDEIADALKKDLGKNHFESYASEIGLVLQEIRICLDNLKKWSRPEKLKSPLTVFPASSSVIREPFGVSLIMSPWNYPFQLTLAPVVGSIAAGNCCVVKPSRYSHNTSLLIEKLMKENFGPEYISVFQGGSETNQALLKEKFDIIFFTGSTSVGRVVMEAAAKNLTPVILELGGKSPVIVDCDADVSLAARRIVWGKSLNAGQTCVAPDYLLADNSVKKELMEKMAAAITEFFGKDPESSEDFSRIINEKHFDRLSALLKGENAYCGGVTDKDSRYIAPSIVDIGKTDSPLMREEIFGPILPVIGFDGLDEAIGFVNGLPKPLALYYFSRDRKKQDRVLKETSSGACCFNDVVVHYVNSWMPLGGVGNSGMGSYHGRASFEAFSHRKSVLRQSNLVDIPVRYPPLKNKLGLLKMFMK